MVCHHNAGYYNILYDTIINICDTFIIIYATIMTALRLFIIGYIVVYLYQATTPPTPDTPALYDAAATPVTDTHD